MRKNDSVPISKEFHFSNKLDNIPRCPKCNLICSLNLYYKEGKPIIKYLCENNHKGAIPLEEYMKQYNKHSLSKQKCDDCNKSQNEIKGGFSNCFKCDKFVCHSCVINHPNDDKHIIHLIIKDMILFVKFILILLIFIVKNVKKIFVYIANLNTNCMK